MGGKCMPHNPPNCHAPERDPLSLPWKARRGPRSFSLEEAPRRLGGGSSPTPKPPRQLRGPEEQGAGQKAPVLNEGPQELGSPPSTGHGAVAT